MKRKKLFTLLAIVLLAACTKTTATTDVTPEQLDGKWILQTVEGITVPETDNTEQPYMLYNLSDSRFACFVGCNRLGGNLHFENGTITLSNALSTKMLCHNEETMKLENRLGAIFEQVTSVKLESETLVLYSADGKQLLTMTK